MRTAFAAAAAFLLLGVSAPAYANAIQPTSYSTWGTWAYWDSSGKELTDGAIPDRHYASYYSASEGYGGPYVGWENVSPEILFSFDGTKQFGNLTVWVDDFGGRWGVTAPLGISAVVGGQTYSNFTVGTPLDKGATYEDPAWGTGGGTPYKLDLTGAQGSSVALTVQRGGQWTFLSEVQFAPAPAPLAAGLPLLLAGAGLAFRRMQRKQS